MGERYGPVFLAVLALLPLLAQATYNQTYIYRNNCTDCNPSCNCTDCTPLPIVTGFPPGGFMEVLWIQNSNPDIIEQPVPLILRGPNQTPEIGYNTRYGANCPTSGPIDFIYWTETPASPTDQPGGSFIYNKSVLIPSSNVTLAPFSAPLIPIEELLAGELAKPVVPVTCDAGGRCMEAFEITAEDIEMDVGFKDQNGNPLLSQFLAYNGQVPGPRFEVQQGVQTLFRLKNNIYCNTTTWKQKNTTCSYYNVVEWLSLHHHGASSLSPFDGWTPDEIPSCAWKDYVYPNERGMAIDAYHDHALSWTSMTVGSGLFGSYYVKPCNLDSIPHSLRVLQPDGNPQQLLIYDLIFWQLPGSRYMNPYMANTLSAFNSTPAPLIAAVAADHVFVNGKPWPQVTVQRKPYWFSLQNAAQTRTFALLLKNNRTNEVLPVWFVGSEGGLRKEPYLQTTKFLMGSGEKYHIVIDFSNASVGDAFVLNNLPTTEANFAQFCYTNLVIKFVVDGTTPRAAPFNPNYTVPRPDQKDIDDACTAADKRGADITVLASLDIKAPNTSTPVVQAWGFLSANWNSTHPNPGMWTVALMPPTNWSTFTLNQLEDPRSYEMGRRSTRRHARSTLRASSSDAATAVAVAPAKRQLQSDPQPFILDTIPTNIAQNAWTSWRITNSGGGTHPHPFHIHVVEFYLCPSNTTLYPKTFSLETPRDSFYLDSGDTTTVVARFGPHQGTYQFHCHNLFHEDAGLMGAFNISNFIKPPPGTTFPNTTYPSHDNYGMGPHAVDKYGVFYPWTDPLVRNVKEYPEVGHNFYVSNSMPYWAYRTDPKNPGRPQPLTKSLIRKVLKRNYYAVYYPRNRDSLAVPDPYNKWAVVCPATAHSSLVE